MKATELRIGNFVYNKAGEVDKVTAIVTTYKTDTEALLIDNHFIGMLNEDFLVSVEYGFTNPIPITEDWLIKFGFEDRNDYWKKKKVKMVWSSRIIKTGERLGIRHEKYDHIKYVHQLQNVYYAVTGEELTVSE
jgi:DNA modification methylase